MELSYTIKHNNIHSIVIPREDKEKGTENIFEEIIEEKFHKSGDEKRHPDPGDTEIPQQNQHKEAHTKTHNNKTGKKIVIKR